MLNVSVWDDWFRRRRRWSIFDDVDKMFEEMFKESLDTLPLNITNIITPVDFVRVIMEQQD